MLTDALLWLAGKQGPGQEVVVPGGDEGSGPVWASGEGRGVRFHFRLGRDAMGSKGQGQAFICWQSTPVCTGLARETPGPAEPGVHVLVVGTVAGNELYLWAFA